VGDDGDGVAPVPVLVFSSRAHWIGGGWANVMDRSEACVACWVSAVRQKVVEAECAEEMCRCAPRSDNDLFGRLGMKQGAGITVNYAGAGHTDRVGAGIGITRRLPSRKKNED
jgi:hypothetical protein